MLTPLRRGRIVLLLGGCLAAAGFAGSSTTDVPQPGAASPRTSVPTVPRHLDSLPFKVGEILSFDVRFGPVRVGHASMEVLGIDDVRGRRAMHTLFHVEGGTPFYRVTDLMESWFDSTLSSLRFHKELNEGSANRVYRYEIFPERGVYVEQTKGSGAERPTVAQPLDDGSFIYFARTLVLRPGESYQFPRYFLPDRNPVVLEVVRRERIEVPAGTFDAIVVRPTVKAKGIFSENGKAELWFTDDPAHLLLQMRSHLSFGTLSLQLREYKR
jgi:uncharacterized protein DUF3108